MNWLRRIFNFYLDASVHVAFAVFSLVRVSEIILNISGNAHLAWFLFFGTIGCYNFIKYGLEAEKYILVANHYHKNIQFFSFIAIALAFYHGYFLGFQTWAGLGCLLFFTGLYALPVLPQAKNLRSLSGLKIFVVALVWSGATVILPVLAAKHTISWDVCIESFQRFVFVLVLLAPFEIRDLMYDKPELKTLPQRFGVAQTKIFGALGAVVFFFLTFLKDDISISEVVVKGVLFLVLGSLMFITKRNQSKYFASFWVEGIPFFWWILAIVSAYFFNSFPVIALSF